MNDIDKGPRLDVRDLRILLALASAGSTARAASVLHLTQPAVSRALLAAEDKLGTRLFERTVRGLTPTAAGQRLCAGATRLLVEWCALEQQACNPVEAPRQIRLVCECYTGYHWLPSALADLRRSFPQLEISLALEHTAEPVAALQANKIDAALLTSATVPRDQLEEQKLFEDEVVFVVSRTHPLAARKTLTARDLRENVLLTSRVPLAEGNWFMARVFGRARPRLQFLQLPLTEAIIDMARAGMGIAILSEWIASPYLAGGELIAKRLVSGPLQRPWRLAWRRELGDVAPRLLSALAVLVPSSRLSS